MVRFSERYGYVKPNEIIVRECITEPIRNSICNWFATLRNKDRNKYISLEKIVWIHFLDKKLDNFPYHDFYEVTDIICNFIDSSKNEWYYKLDLIEFVCPYIKNVFGEVIFGQKVQMLNNEFQRHNFAYRLINGKIVEITTECEIKSIEDAINNSDENVRTHLRTALEKLSLSQRDYRNSIKESISAVECVCREITSESTLDRALKNLENRGVVLNPRMKEGLKNLYFYTNDGSTGIRHALMDDANAPTADEAIFMLVSCSAFVNYLMKKK